MIKDRGSMKRTVLTLPEHVKMLSYLDKAQDKVDKPILNEDQLEDINQTIYEALEYNKELVFTYFDNGDMKLYVGHIHFLDDIKQELRLMNGHGDKFNMKFKDILRVDYRE